MQVITLSISRPAKNPRRGLCAAAAPVQMGWLQHRDKLIDSGMYCGSRPRRPDRFTLCQLSDLCVRQTDQLGRTKKHIGHSIVYSFSASARPLKNGASFRSRIRRRITRRSLSVLLYTSPVGKVKPPSTVSSCRRPKMLPMAARRPGAGPSCGGPGVGLSGYTVRRLRLVTRPSGTRHPTSGDHQQRCQGRSCKSLVVQVAAAPSHTRGAALAGFTQLHPPRPSRVRRGAGAKWAC